MDTPPTPTLQIVRILPAPPAEVYAAWTDPVQLARWFCPGETRKTEASLDLRVGGRYRIVMHDASRATVHEGEYLELRPPTRLVFSWASSYTRDRPTRVTIELLPEGADRTRLVLTHEELPDEESRRDHERGWTSAAAKLDAYLARGETMGIRGFEGQRREYRVRRDELLRAEIELKDQRERVAALRRRLPLGAPVTTDYVFREAVGGLRPGSTGSTRDVRLSDLFGVGKDHLILVHTMWAEANERPCPMCNMWAAGYDAVARFVSDKVGFALAVKQDVERLRAWARQQGWQRIRLLSSGTTTFNRDYGVEDENGEQKPAVSVFSRASDGTIHHFYTTEASLASGHHRGIDLFSPVWNLFDLLPDGRGDWMPRHTYDDLEIDLTFRAPAARVYEAIATESGVRGWWTELCEMDARVGGAASFRFPRTGFFAAVEIAALRPPSFVEWRCIDSQHPAAHGFADLKDWIGTTIRFAIEPLDAERSRLHFAHVGLGPLECAGVCTSAWSFFLATSLRGYVEQGRGEAYR